MQHRIEKHGMALTSWWQTLCIWCALSHLHLIGQRSFSSRTNYNNLLLLASLATTFLWLSTGTWTDEMVAGRFNCSIHQKASTSCSCTMFPSTDRIVETSSKGTEGLPCDLTTQLCPQHHHTNCDTLLLLEGSSETVIAFVKTYLGIEA